MKREIKFRGKVIDSDKWVFGDLLWNNGVPIIVQQVSRSYVEGGLYWHIETPAYKVDTSTVGQFTGLLDKNGNEIYEGDVIMLRKYKRVVKYNSRIAQFRGYLFKYNSSVELYQSESHETKIIGNIHDKQQ